MTNPKTPAGLSWSYNPWRADWRRPALALAIEIAVALLAGFSVTTPADRQGLVGWICFALLLLFGMTATLFVPVRYTLDEQGVLVRFIGTPGFRKWEHYRNFYAHKGGVHLTTMPTPSPLDPFRGHYLVFDGNREAVLDYLQAHILREEKPAEAAE